MRQVAITVIVKLGRSKERDEEKIQERRSVLEITAPI